MAATDGASAAGTEPAAPSAPLPTLEPPITPRSDLRDAIGWIVLGIAVLVGSLTMDRLERQHINPYTVPGLLPGLLGVLMIALGGLLLARSLRRGALRAAPQPDAASASLHREAWRRIAVTTLLCGVYGVVLIGHGLPFWAASALYVTGSILVLQRIDRDAQARRFTPRGVVQAVVIGLVAAVVTHLVFQEVFLVRLP